MTGRDDRSPLRTFIAAELPETRIFVDRLYREFTASGRRLHIEEIVRKCGGLSWLLSRIESAEPCK